MTIDFEKILGLLSSMYLCKPTMESIENWKTVLSEEVRDFMLGLRDAIDEIDPHSERELEDLLWEYTRLFIGPFKLPCPPWESVYTSGRRLMMQEAYDEVQHFYREVGLEIGNPGIMPDHIGVELNFLAILIQKMNGEPEKRLHYTEIGKRFLDEHLTRWIPQFTLDMEEATDSLFYKTLAKATRDFMTTECHFLGNILGITDTFESKVRLINV